MQPIHSLWHICLAHGLSRGQIMAIQSLIDKRKGVLHPYWVQLTLNVQYDFAKHLYDELITNEWAVPDMSEVEGSTYESELNDDELGKIAELELLHERDII